MIMAAPGVLMELPILASAKPNTLTHYRSHRLHTIATPTIVALTTASHIRRRMQLSLFSCPFKPTLSVMAAALSERTLR
jgi:hypothetical protein